MIKTGREQELRYWAGQIARGRISRREFLGRAAAMGVTTALATTLLSKAGVAAEPKRGGFARFALPHGATTDSLDPGTWPDTFTQTAFYGTLCNNLTEIGVDGGVAGDLAESFEAADGAKKWVFKLRKGVTFHNGKDLTATDVVGSYRYHMAPDSRSAVKSLLQTVTNVETDGPETVIFTLSSGSADFPYLAADQHLTIFPAADGGGIDPTAGIGSGPFVLERFEPGVSAKFKRNPNYHKDGKPYFDEVEHLVILDVSARTAALASGEVHYMASCDLKTLSLLQRNPEIEILEVTGVGHNTLPMNAQIAPFDNNDVRLALKYALDREAILQKIFLGHGKAGNDNPIAASTKYAIDPQPRFAYDPERVKFHLNKAGLSSLKVDLSVAEAAFAGATDAALLYKDQAAKVGIDINVVREPNDGYWDNIWMKKPWCASFWSGRPTCDWMFTTAFADGAPWNESNWKNPRFNELLVAARSELDDKKRGEMYAEMQQLVHDDGSSIVLVFANYVSAHSKALAHGPVAAHWENDGFRIAERWWFA